MNVPRPDRISNSQPDIQEVPDADLLRVRLTDRVVTIPTRCPHKGAPLVDGRILRGTFLECPWHGATFDLRTGRRLRGPECADLATVEGT